MQEPLPVARYGRTLIVILLIAAAGAGIWPRLWAPTGQNKHHLHQARAFLAGRLDVPAAFGDVVTFEGRHYIVFPPLPSLLITPAVYFLGDEARSTVLSLLLTILNVFVLRGVLRRLEVEPRLQRWLLAAFFLGTAYTTSLFQAYEFWHYAHIVAVTFLLVAVWEALGRGRGLLVGLCCGLAFLSRHLCIYAAIFLLALVWERSRERPLWRRAANLAGFGAVLGASVGVYLYLNWLRFGDPLETGYRYMPLKGVFAERVAFYGLFHPAYVPFNLTYLFLQGFHIAFDPPRMLSAVGLDPFGTSVTFASPFLFLALLARWRRPLLIAAWISIALPILHALFYYNNGAGQANAQRFMLDWLPVVIVLVALGMQRARAIWWQAAIAYSVALNAAAFFLVNWLQRLTAPL